MKKIVITTILCGVVAASYAMTQDEKARIYQEKWARDYYAKLGMPIPDGGVVIKPMTEMSKEKNILDKRLLMKSQVKKLGYIDQYNENAIELINFKNISAQKFNAISGTYNNESDYKKNIDEIKMAYTFVGVPMSQLIEIYGYSPYLSFIKDKGWVGAQEIFESKYGMNCVYNENNIKLSHGSVVIAEEDVKYLVNGKASIATVMGNKSSGFTYKIEWYDNAFFRELECAASEYNPKLINKVIRMAVSADNS